MAVTLKILGGATGIGGVTTAGTYDISPVSSPGKGWLVKNITFYNRGTNTTTIDLMVKAGAGYRMLKKSALSLAAGAAQPVERDITLDLGTDTLAAALSITAGTTISIDYVINGVERDQ
jgi:hypothetical protein